MDFSNSWLVDEYIKYERRFLKQPIFISDWDPDTTDLVLPERIIQKTIELSSKDFNKYVYIDSDTEEKEYFIDYLNTKSFKKIKYINVSINLNATNSIYLSLIALNNLQVKRFLVITPTYYTILETLRHLNCNIVYYHLIDKESFVIDFDDISNTIKSQFIEAIILTDPIYSAGIEIPTDFYIKISELCERLNIWLICDYTLGGMFWDKNEIDLINFRKFNIISKISKFVYIESVPKKLFLNGIKHSTVISSPEVISIIEDAFFRISGGFCNTQIRLYKEIYKPENKTSLIKIIKKNIKTAQNNYNILKVAITGSSFDLYDTNSGYFTALFHKNFKLEDLKIKLIVKDFLFKNSMYVYPTNTLSYYSLNQFAFRINLLKDIKRYIPLILKCINKNFYHFYKCS